MTDDERTVEQLRKEILEWADKLRQQDRDRKLRLGQARPRNRREDDLFAVDLLREPDHNVNKLDTPKKSPEQPKTPRGKKGDART